MGTFGNIIFSSEIIFSGLSSSKYLLIAIFGETIFIYKFKQISIRADKVDEFWKITQDDAYNKYILKEQVIKIEESKSNTRRRVSKKAG